MERMVTEGQDVLFQRDSDVFPELGLIVMSEAILGDNDVWEIAPWLLREFPAFRSNIAAIFMADE
jgi:hypothetical protein